MADQKSQAQGKPPLSRLAVFGWIFAALSVALAVRLVWEMTFLTWEQGPQMVGFRIAHGPGVFLLLGAVLGIVWLVVYVGISVWRRSLGGWASILSAMMVIASYSVLEIPYGYWQRSFADRIIQSGQAPEVLLFAAGMGDVDTARIFISRGTSVRYCDSGGRTVLHAAASGGSLEIVQLALEHGAEINALSDYGESPAQVAEERGHARIVRYLVSHGGKKITGCPKQGKSGMGAANPDREICNQYRCNR